MSCTNRGNGQEKACSLGSFERNRYFYGKLMTVLDFNDEQKYFNEKRWLLNRLIHGTGIVCGLELGNTEEEVRKSEFNPIKIVFNNDKTLYLNPGVALDCHGREIVVPPGAEIEKLKDPLLQQGTHYLYVRFHDCAFKKVPAVSNPSGCEEVCCDSRIEERFEIVIDSKEPHRHPVNWKDTINWKDDVWKDIDINNLAESIAAAKQRNNTLFEDNKQSKELLTVKKLLETFSCNNSPADECKDPKVLIGVIIDGEISEIKTTTYRSVVPTNPILSELIDSHLRDFDNPHKTTAAHVKALMRINGVGNYDNDKEHVPEVKIDSTSGAGEIDITSHTSENKINIQVADDAITGEKIADDTITRDKMKIDVISGVYVGDPEKEKKDYISPDNDGNITVESGKNITITPIDHGFNIQAVGGISVEMLDAIIIKRLIEMAKDVYKEASEFKHVKPYIASLQPILNFQYNDVNLKREKLFEFLRLQQEALAEILKELGTNFHSTNEYKRFFGEVFDEIDRIRPHLKIFFPIFYIAQLQERICLSVLDLDRYRFM